MPDPRVEKLAQVLVHYSLDLRPGQQMVLFTTPLAEELTLAVYQAAMESGAHVFIWNQIPQADEIFYKFAGENQLDYVSPVSKLIFETFDARLSIGGEQNTRMLTGSDPERRARRSRANRPLWKLFLERSARGELRWCTTEYPTHASAQEADMSLLDYQDFVYRAGKLNEPDPVAAWQKEAERMGVLVSRLQGGDQLILQGKDIDLRLSIKDRRFIASAGKENFPDGEIFTGPVENSATGWVRFRYPAIFDGREVHDIELWFEDGRVVREKAAKGQDFLTSRLNTDPGARYLGELGIGTNYEITRFTKNMLFDEKIGGTIHLALGASYHETGGQNESSIHWDMLCDLTEGEIRVDGEVFYRDGKPYVE